MPRNFGGVWPLPARPGRPKPYGVQWRETTWDRAANDGRGAEVDRRPSEFFATEEQRDKRAAQLRKDRAKGALHTVTRGALEEYRSFLAATGGAPWQDVVAGWRAHQVSTGVIECNVLIGAAVQTEIDRAKKLLDGGKMADGSFRHKKQKITAFAEFFGHLAVNRVSGNEIEMWADSIDGVESGAAFNKYVKQVATVFRPYVKNGTLRVNPCAAVRLRDEKTDEVGILTVQETAHLFAFALQSDRYRVAVGRLALEFFLGFRFSSACRLEKKDINFADRGVILPRKKLKTGMVEGGRAHYIDGKIPKQLWRWLAVTPEACWSLTARQYLTLKSDLFRDARVLHPNNCSRHSFCSYDIAAHKDAARTAYLLCHQDQQLVWNTYRGHQARGVLVTERMGRLYQIITPKTAHRLARGYVSSAEILLLGA